MNRTEKTIGLAILFLAIVLLPGPSKKPFAADKPEAEKKEIIAQAEEAKTSDAKELLNRADEVFRKKQYAESRKIYQQALEAAKAEGNNSDMTEAMAMIARTCLIGDDKKSGYHWLNSAEKLALPQEPLGWSRVQSVRGRFLWQEKRLIEATKLFKELYQYCSDRKLHERAIDAAHMVAITADHEEQIIWGKKGIREAEAGSVTGWLGPLWNNLGVTYEDMEQYDSSLAAYKKAREYHYRHGTESNKMIADWAVGHAFLNLKDYDEAEKWLEPLVEWCEKLEDNEFLGFTCRDLGKVNLAGEKYQSALDYFIRAEKLLKEAGMPDWNAEGYDKLLNQIKELRRKIE